MKFAGKWLEIENIMGEVIQTQNDMHGMYSLTFIFKMLMTPVVELGKR